MIIAKFARAPESKSEICLSVRVGRVEQIV